MADIDFFLKLVFMISKNTKVSRMTRVHSSWVEF